MKFSVCLTNWGRAKVERRQLRHELKNKAVLRLKNALFTVKKMHLREKAARCSPVVGFFLNRPFLCQKHHFKTKKRYDFYHISLIVKRSPWTDPISGDF